MRGDLADLWTGDELAERLARRVLDQSDHIEANVAPTDQLRVDTTRPDEAPAPALDNLPHALGIALIGLGTGP